MRTTRCLAALLAVAFAAPAGARAQDAVGCSWPVLGNSDTLNVAFPDEAARYWLAVLPSGPGVTRLMITGAYPQARYFSFHAYDASQRPVGAIADFELAPDAGSTNPYVDGPGPGPHAYTAYVQFADEPATPAPNTFYTGAANPVAALIYRIYVPDDPASEQGSVPLPTIAVERIDGSAQIVELGPCQLASPSAGGSVNETINQTTFPNSAPRPAPWIRAEDPPFFERAGGPGAALEDDVPPNPVTDPLFEGDAASFLSNTHNAYVRGSFARRYGDVFVVRAKAPTFPDTRAGEQVAVSQAQLRYWSVCMNEFATQRFVKCIADYQAVIDADGFVTFVVADPEDRPANADAAHGINFLPWPGAYYDGLLLYRHMLPSPDFAEAIQRQPVATPITTEMGHYGLVARYCARATIEALGAAACLP